MAPVAHRAHVSIETYLALETSSPIKHEFWDGNIYAMAGGSPEHAALAASLLVLLGSQLSGGRCRPYGSDLRVRVPETGLDTYPDLSVVCGPRVLDTEDRHAATNPTVLVEILSESSEAYDRGDKFEHYKRLASLQHYVLVSQTERRVEVWTRTGAADWLLAIHGEGDAAALPSIGAQIDVRALYDAASDPTA